MDKINKKHYIRFDVTSASGYPTGKTIFYECTKCGDILPSLPKDCVSCTCRNIRIDIYAGRLVVEDHVFFKIFSAEDNQKVNEKSNVSIWFLSLIFTVSAVVLINQLWLIRSNDKKILVILISLPLVAFILWLFFKTGIASWAERWIKSSLDDFFREVEKGKNKNKK